MLGKIIEFLAKLFSGADKKPTTTSQRGIDLIKEFEGLRLQSYKDSAGVWTIGYGHTKTAEPGQSITKEGAENLLRLDLVTHNEPINRLVKVPLNQKQFDALSSFVFNLGGKNFANSTLLKKLNAGDYDGAANEFGRWIYAGGKPLNGLAKRRAKEKLLFEGRI